jgi:hypothetical protein
MPITSTSMSYMPSVRAAWARLAWGNGKSVSALSSFPFSSKMAYTTFLGRKSSGLLAGDMVEAIIRLPGGLIPFRPGYETALWVLIQARVSRWRGRVLLADVSD